MVLALTVILICQLVGEVVRAAVSATGRDDPLETAGKGLLAHLSLLFVPAGVGVIQRLDVFATYGVALAASLVLSTIAALLASVLAFVLAARAFRVPGEAP